MWLFEDSERQFKRKRKTQITKALVYHHVHSDGRVSVRGVSVDGFGCCNAIPTGEYEWIRTGVR